MDARDWGLVPDSSVPQDIGGLWRRAIDECEHLRLPAGRVVATEHPRVPDKPSGPLYCSGEGTGSGNSRKALTTIVLPDGPKGTVADPCTGAYEYLLEDVAFVGPSKDAPLGGSPADCDGLLLHSKGIVRNVWVQGVDSGFRVESDHVTMENFHAHGCGDGLNFSPNMAGGMGDLVFDGFDLTGNKRSSVGVSAEAMVAFATFRDGHIGMSPYCFRRYDSNRLGGLPGTRRKFLDWVVLDHVSAEGDGNGFAFDEPGDGDVGNIHLFLAAAAASFSSRWRWQDKPSRAYMDVRNARNVVWWGKPPFWDKTHPAVSAREMINLWGLPDFGGMLSTVANGTGVLPLELKPGSPLARPLEGVHFGALAGKGGAIQWHRAGEDLRQYDLLEFTKYGDVVRSRNGPDSDIAGSCGRSVLKGAAAPTIVRGATAAVRVNNYGPKIPAWTLVGPDPDHPGGVCRVDGNMRRYVGRTTAAIDSMTDGPVDADFEAETPDLWSALPPSMWMPAASFPSVLGPGTVLEVQADGVHVRAEA